MISLLNPVAGRAAATSFRKGESLLVRSSAEQADGSRWHGKYETFGGSALLFACFRTRRPGFARHVIMQQPDREAPFTARIGHGVRLLVEGLLLAFIDAGIQRPSQCGAYAKQ
jgi:hypothetical protein